MNNNDFGDFISGEFGGGGEADSSDMATEFMGEVPGSVSSDLPGLLDQTSVECQRLSGGNELVGSLRLHTIRDKYPEDYKSLEGEVKRLVGKYVQRTLQQDFGPSKRYVSDVILYQNVDECRRLRRWLSGKGSTYPGRLYMWFEERDHFHVIHDCPWSNGSCRCRWYQEATIRRNIRKPLRRTKFIRELGVIDWYNVFLYFALQKWESRQEIWIGGTLQRSPSNSEGLQWFDLLAQSRTILGREGEGTGYNDSEQASNSQEGGRNLRGHSSNVEQKGSKFERVSKEVQALLTKYHCIPLTEVRNIIPSTIPVFNLLHNPNNDKFYNSACHVYSLYLNKLTLEDFHNLYSEGCPIFYANDMNPFTYYHSREDSAKFLIDLLKFQYNDNNDRIIELLGNIKCWFNKEGWNQYKNGEWVLNPKINSIAINGPPNSGKNYFWDTIAAVATNVGHIGRVSNKCNQFSLQDIYNRRLVMGNELNMEDAAKDDFKKLCEGTAFNIRVKYQGDKIFTRTPVCFITNGVLEISTDFAFKNVRLVTFQWKACPLLAKSSKKPYPLALFDVFDYFNVSIK